MHHRTTALALLAITALACARHVYRIGMDRDEIYEYAEAQKLELFVSEVRIGDRHDVIMVPQSGFPRPFDENVLSGRPAFGSFRPTDTESQEYEIWMRAVSQVQLWHALIVEDYQVREIIDDENYDRLIDRVLYWFQDNVNRDIGEDAVKPLRLEPSSG